MNNSYNYFTGMYCVIEFLEHLCEEELDVDLPEPSAGKHLFHELKVCLV